MKGVPTLGNGGKLKQGGLATRPPLTRLFGLVLIAWPATGALALIWMFGSISMLAGVIMIIISLRFKGDLKMMDEEVKAATGSGEQPSAG